MRLPDWFYSDKTAKYADGDEQAIEWEVEDDIFVSNLTDFHDPARRHVLKDLQIVAKEEMFPDININPRL
jgi:hypothetical protein